MKTYPVTVEIKGLYIIVAEHEQQAKEAVQEEMDEQKNSLENIIQANWQLSITHVSATEGSTPVRLPGASLQSFDVAYLFKGVVYQTARSKKEALETVESYLNSKKVYIDDIIMVDFEVRVYC
jgi:uncharacterized NAD(P)/FAD-binding protein YdhS